MSHQQQDECQSEQGYQQQPVNAPNVIQHDRSNNQYQQQGQSYPFQQGQHFPVQQGQHFPVQQRQQFLVQQGQHFPVQQGHCPVQQGPHYPVQQGQQFHSPQQGWMPGQHGYTQPQQGNTHQQGNSQDFKSLSNGGTGAAEPMDYCDGQQEVPPHLQQNVHGEPQNVHAGCYQTRPQQGLIWHSPSGTSVPMPPTGHPRNYIQPSRFNPTSSVPYPNLPQGQQTQQIPQMQQQQPQLHPQFTTYGPSHWSNAPGQNSQPPPFSHHQPPVTGCGTAVPPYSPNTQQAQPGQQQSVIPQVSTGLPTTNMEKDKEELRLHFLNLGPKTSEDALENFIESCARAEIAGFDWAANKKSVVVTFKTKPDASAVTDACRKNQVEGRYLEVQTVPKPRCLKVTGLSPDCTEDSVRYYFENKKRGGPIEDLYFFQEKQTAFVRFENYGDAGKALTYSPHSLRDCPLQVCLQPDLPGYMELSDDSDTQVTAMPSLAENTHEAAAEVDEMKILVMNLSAKTSEDTLRNFLESKAEADVTVIEYGSNKTSAVVSFETKPDIQAVKSGCETRKVDGQKLEITTVNRSKCVKVTDLASDITEDSVRYYFENKKRGGPVADVELYQEANTAFVRFEQYGVAEKVCSMSHKLREKVLNVQIQTDTPGFLPGRNLPDVKRKEQAAVEDNPEDSVEVLKLLVKGINPVTTEDALKDFLEAKADADVQHVEWGKGKTAAVVTFDAKPDIVKLKKACQTRPIENQKLTVDFVPKSRSLRVTGLADNVTEDSVLYYFENKKKSGGGTIEDINLLCDTNTAIVRFERVGVAEQVCLKKHTLSGKSLTVVVHQNIPGFVLAGDESEEPKESTSKSVSSTWAHLIKDVPPLLFRYLNKSENEKRKLNEAVQRFDGRTRFIQQPKGVILEVSYTGQTGTWTQNAWMRQVDCAVKKSIEDMDLVVNDTDIPDGCHMEQIEELLKEKVNSCHIRVYHFQQKVHVVGHRDNVEDAISSLKEMLDTVGPKESDSFPVKAYQVRYLQLSDFLSTCPQRYPSVDVQLEENQVVVTGPKQYLRTVKLSLLEMLCNLNTGFCTFKTTRAVEILDSLLADRLLEEKINCVWDVDSKTKITLFSESDEAIEKTKDIIKSTISEEIIRLDISAAKNLQSADWREKRRSLMEENEGRLVITEESDVVTVAGDSDIFQNVITEIDKFFEITTVRHVLLQADSSKVKFLKDHSTAKIRRIQQKFSSEKVTIDFDEGSYSCGVKISGLNEGIAKAKKEIENHLALIKCKEVKLGLPGIGHFFKEGKGRDMLTAIEQNTHTVIRPKDRLNRKKSVKCWTTSAGVVSVLKGDMCHLKVDAIVFSANKDLKLVAGLGKAIAEKGGKDIQDEADKYIKKKGRLSDGEVVCTGSGRLSCKSVFHAVVPKWQGTSSAKDQLKTILINILKICDKKNLVSIALPALGTGQGFPRSNAVKVIVETLHDQWGEREGKNVQEVILCDIKPATVGEFVKTCEAVFAGARPRHLTEEEEEDGSFDDMSQGGSESESNDSVTDSDRENSGIQVVIGELAKIKADVLVNPTGKDLNMSAGAVSKSLLEAGGPAIQSECKEKYPGGLKDGKIAVTTGGRLNCKEIFHGTLKKWDQGGEVSDLVLKTMVFKCLKEADSRGFKSIAFPALGTGKLGFPAHLSASLMFEAASNFLRNNPGSSVKSITFVIHHKDTAVKKAFMSRDPGQRNGRSEETSKSYDHKGQNQDSSRREEGPYRRGSVKVDILKGDLTREKTDCIVSCSDESFDLRHGALSKAILAQAGPNLQDECRSKQNDLSRNGLAVTKGYHLSCKKVIHLKVQSSPREWGSLLLLCLEEAESRGMTSLSLPALGTGGQKLSPEKMASSLLYAVNKFADRHKHSTLTLIRVVIFQGSMVNTYRAVFAGSKPGTDGRTGQQHSRGGRTPGPHENSRDQIVLCIFSDSQDDISEARDRIQSMCREEFDQKRISDPYASKIDRLEDGEISHLHSIATKHNVVLTRKKSELVLMGRVKDVSEVKDQILSKFQGDTMSEHMKEEAKMVAKLVQWSYVVDDKSNPFTVGLNCRLEKAHNAKEKPFEIKDPKGRSYTVDLKKMTEYPKGGGKPIKLERFEKAIRPGLSKMVKGEKEAMAGTKTVYFTLQPVRNFKGDAEDLHFRTAESQFYRLLGASSSQFTVQKVEYVVNPSLIKKFRAAQNAIKTKRGADMAEPVLAFHGTNEGYIKSICENGFKKPGDAGFAAKTDAGYYGSGVYFSEFPGYSMPYINGAQKLLLSQVIQGKVYKCTGLMNGAPLQTGYDSHTSPDGKELIIFDTACILPCYIVHFGGSSGDFKYQ